MFRREEFYQRYQRVERLLDETLGDPTNINKKMLNRI